MRPQQNRRMRGRGGNNNSNNNNNNGGRKGPNPLTRSYESNGPDVKIRGSAQQIAEKYTTLARDAQTSGDRVMAENYLQHAEHYNRIIMAAQAQMPQQQQRDNRDDDDGDEDGDNEGVDNQTSSGEQQDRRQQQHARSDGSGPQPVIEGVPAEVALNQQGNSTQEPRDETAKAENAPRARAKAKTESEDGEAVDEQAVPRKPRRPRRPRVKAGEEGAAPNEEEPSSGSDEPVTEAAQ